MTPEAVSARVVEVDGHPTRVLEVGQGPPVVVLHGWGGRIESMAPITARLAREFKTIAIDLPGFGESPLPQDVWGTQDYASHVQRVLAHLGVARAPFVGHSFGAKTSVYLAASSPEVVEKLVLAGSSGLRTPPCFKARVKRAASKAARTIGRAGLPGRKIRDAVYRRVASDDYREAGAIRPILVRVVNEDFSRLLPLLRCPVLLVWGSKDDAVPFAHARRMERLIPDAGLVELEGAGHFAYLEEPDRFVRIVTHFLKA